MINDNEKFFLSSAEFDSYNMANLIFYIFLLDFLLNDGLQFHNNIVHHEANKHLLKDGILYTTDNAENLTRGDLGGRRLIK